MNALIERLFRDQKIQVSRQNQTQLRASDLSSGMTYVYDMLEGDDAVPEIYSTIDQVPEPEPDKNVKLVRDFQAMTWGAAILHVRFGEWSLRTTGWDQLEHLVGPYFIARRDGANYLINVAARDPNRRELKK